MPSIEDPAGGKDFVSLRMGYFVEDAHYRKCFVRILESSQRTFASPRTMFGEAISISKCPPNFQDQPVLLRLTPGVVFAKSGYWAFSAILCEDNQVLEERFVDWETEDVAFEGLIAAPLRTFSIGFFVYERDPISGLRSSDPRFCCVLALRMVHPSVQGDHRGAPKVDYSFLADRAHPFHPQAKFLPQPHPPAADRKPGFNLDSYGRFQSIGTPVPPYEPPAVEARSPSVSVSSSHSPNKKRKVDQSEDSNVSQMEDEMVQMAEEVEMLRRKVQEKRQALAQRKSRMARESSRSSSSRLASSDTPLASSSAHPTSTSTWVSTTKDRVDRSPGNSRPKSQFSIQKTAPNITSSPSPSTSRQQVRRRPFITADLSDSDDEGHAVASVSEVGTEESEPPQRIAVSDSGEGEEEVPKRGHKMGQQRGFRHASEVEASEDESDHDGGVSDSDSDRSLA